MTTPDAQLEDLTDAVSRGRLALAEIAGMTVQDLDILFELAAQRLDTGRDRDAADMLGALVTLFPYSARFWRAYGIALHRLLLLTRARAAYDAAWLLAPEDMITLCYRGEVLLYMEEHEAARKDLETVVAGPRLDMARRAADLLQLLELPGWRPPPPAPTPEWQPAPEPQKVRFSLRDGRTLPLEESRFSPLEEPPPDDKNLPVASARARTFANAVATRPSPERHRDDITETAIVRRRTTPRRGALHAHDEITATAVVRRRGLIAQSPTSAEPMQTSGFSTPNEDTVTAVMRRREGLSLLDDETHVADAANIMGVDRDDEHAEDTDVLGKDRRPNR